MFCVGINFFGSKFGGKLASLSRSPKKSDLESSRNPYSVLAGRFPYIYASLKTEILLSRFHSLILFHLFTPASVSSQTSIPLPWCPIFHRESDMEITPDCYCNSKFRQIEASINADLKTEMVLLVKPNSKV